MSKKTRWIIFMMSVIVFIAASYFMVVYALGYKIDFVDFSLVSTGSFRVIANVGADVYVNGELEGKTSFFEKSFSLGRLLPRSYTIRLERTDYQPWQKNLQIKAGYFTDVPKIVLVPIKFTKEEISSSSFGFFEYDSNERESDGILLTINDNEIIIKWNENTSYQPFKINGEEETILRFTSKIDDAQWYKDNGHIFVLSGGILSFYEIDTRGGINGYQLAATKGPFFYNKDKNEVYFVDSDKIVKIPFE